MLKNSLLHEMLLMLLVGISGLLMVVLPAALVSVPVSDTGLFPWLEAGIKLAGIHTVLLFAAGGFLTGMIRSKRAWLTAAGLILPLYVLALVEMAWDPGSHNLWPIEFLIYTVPGGAAVLTSLIAARMVRRSERITPSAG